MKNLKILVGAVLAGLLGLGAWAAWTWYTTPVVPPIAVENLQGELRVSIEEALKQVRLKPRSADAWSELSLRLVANELNDLAIPCLAQLERLEPTEARWPYWHGMLVAISNHREGIAILRRAVKLAQLPENKSAVLTRLALAQIENDQLDEAAEHLRLLEALEPGSPRVHYGLGLLAIARNDRAAAGEHLRTLLENPHARKTASSLLASVSEGDTAAAYQQQALGLPPDLPWPTSYELDIQRYKVERADRLARFYELGRAGRQGEALEHLRELVATAPDDQTCFALGYTLLSMNRLDEGERYLRQALTHNRHHVKAGLYLGTTLLLQGEQRLDKPNAQAEASKFFTQAVAVLDQTLRLQGDLTKAHLARGQALKRLGRTEECLLALRQAVLVGPNSADVHLALGEALAEAGQLPEALEYLRHAARLADAQQDPRARQALEKWQSKAKLKR